MRLQTSPPPPELLPAAAGDVHCPCSSSVWSQLDGLGQGLPGAHGGSEPWPQEQSWVTPHHQLCSCHTVQGSEPPFTTHTHLDAREVSSTRESQQAHGSSQAAVIALNHTEGSGLGHATAVAPDPPCLPAGRVPQHPRPLNTPRRFEHNSSWVLTFSTSSFQSCRGHRATGKKISVGDVVKHSALTPTGKDAPGTHQANFRDKPALHPAAAAKSLPLPLVPAPSSSVSQWESKSLPQSQQHASSAPCQGCYSHCIPQAPEKKGINRRAPCTARLIC